MNFSEPVEFQTLRESDRFVWDWHFMMNESAPERLIVCEFRGAFAEGRWLFVEYLPDAPASAPARLFDGPGATWVRRVG